jgi:hypothetical protein
LDVEPLFTTDKFKAQFVARGFQQKEGINFDETFTPLVNWGTIQSIVALATHSNWQKIHLDVKTGFLNGDLHEVFMRQPEGFSSLGNERKVCCLLKALYGLKYALRAWYSKIDTYFKFEGLQRSNAYHNLCFLHENEKVVILVLYVDDLLLIGSHSEKIVWLMEQLLLASEMTDLDAFIYF